MPLYIAKDGQTFGPHKLEEIAVFLNTGDFQPEDFCWQEGWPEWRTLSSVIPTKPLPASPNALSTAPPISTPPLPSQKNQIPDDIEIVGTLKIPTDRIVTCHVDGDIISPATVTISREAKVKARIKAESVIIYGNVEGDIHAATRAVLKSTATLVGDIYAPRVLVEEGATFSGKSHVSPKSSPPKSKSSTPPARKSAPSSSTRRS